MAGSLKDILSHLSTEIDQETLLLYLQDKLSEEKKHEVEKKLMENDFDTDALEGLQEFSNKRNINHLVEQLNRDLKLKITKKKKRRQNLQLKEQPWLYISIVIILILIVVSFVVIRKQLMSH